MSGIAELLINLGYRVSGSDIRASSMTDRLSASGGEIFLGHNRENIQGADVVVYSSAVSLENPELEQAKEVAADEVPKAKSVLKKKIRSLRKK